MAEGIGKFSSAACGGPPTNPPCPCGPHPIGGLATRAPDGATHEYVFIATMVDIEELIDNVLAGQHPKMRERCSLPHTSGSPVGVAPVFCISARRKNFARLRRALFSYVLRPPASIPNMA